jgi:sirohydrochlorin cobaltochelatase
MGERSGLILYVHGARDPRWARPFERLRARIAERHPDVPVTLAFLEHMTPDLVDAAKRLADEGVSRIRVVPLFFGRGGHLRLDLPRQLAAARSGVPAARFDVTVAAGEDDGVLDALATFALEALPVSGADFE